MKTIAAISTPSGAGAMGVIRISGEQAKEIAEKVFSPVDKTKKISNLSGYSACYGKVFDSDGFIDDGVLLNFNAPFSYTGEDVVEISLHGGEAVLKKALRAVFEMGAFPAQAGEFTKRAFLNGKMSLTQAEAVMDVISAQSSGALQAANATKNGAVYKEINSLKEKLTYCAAQIAAFVDYPDEGHDEMDHETFSSYLEIVNDSLVRLISDYDAGSLIKNGVDCVIVGKPNVGKSTLMNLFSKSEKSIVTPIAGTTRDVVQETVDIGGLVLHLSDTAGIRSSADEVEKIGIQRAKEKLKNAQLVLAVFSADSRLDDDDFDILKTIKNIPSVLIVNKTDLADADFVQEIEKYSSVVLVSAKNNVGIEQLRNEIMKVCNLSHINPQGAMLANERQLASAKVAQKAVQQTINDYLSGLTLDVLSITIEEALEALCELSGESASQTIVNEVFSKFCVGK